MDPVLLALVAFLTELLKLANTIETRIASDPTMSAEMNKLLLDRLTRLNRYINWVQDKIDHLAGIVPAKETPTK